MNDYKRGLHAAAVMLIVKRQQCIGKLLRNPSFELEQAKVDVLNEVLEAIEMQLPPDLPGLLRFVITEESFGFEEQPSPRYATADAAYLALASELITVRVLLLGDNPRAALYQQRDHWCKVRTRFAQMLKAGVFHPKARLPL